MTSEHQRMERPYYFLGIYSLRFANATLVRIQPPYLSLSISLSTCLLSKIKTRFSIHCNNYKSHIDFVNIYLAEDYDAVMKLLIF